jgi:hypothetical protein
VSNACEIAGQGAKMVPSSLKLCGAGHVLFVAFVLLVLMAKCG